MSVVTIDAKAIPAPVYRDLIASIKNFYRDPVNRSEFERWREEKHSHKPQQAAYINNNERGE